MSAKDGGPALRLRGRQGIDKRSIGPVDGVIVRKAADVNCRNAGRVEAGGR